MSDIPYGFCHCGCGEKTKISRWSNAAEGYVKGEPRRFLRGHHNPYRGKAIRTARDNGDGTYSIPLTKGYMALIDKDDLEKVSAHNWFVVESRGTAYAARAGKRGIDPHHILLHRVIAGAPKDLQVDHIDGDGLNNTRSNLRLCSQAENMLNKSSYVNSPTGYRGVYPVPSGRYIARIRVDGRWVNLGTYDTTEEAAMARDEATRSFYGDFGRMNIKEKDIA